MSGVEDQEGLTEASRESGLGLSDTLLSSGNLSSVTRDEVVHGLSRGQLGDWGEDTESIASQHDNVFGVVANAGDECVGDVLDGVSAASVLGQGLVIVVDETGVLIKDNVLKNGSEANSVEDLGLLLSREINALGVAASLNVEDSSVGPDVLIITDQGAGGVSRQGGLASSRETEEQGGVAVGSLVGRGVKGKNTSLGHEVVHDGEDTLLHLSSVLGSENDHLAKLEVDGD